MKNSKKYLKLSVFSVLLIAGLLLTGCSLLPSESDAQAQAEPTAVQERVVESDGNVSEGSIVPRDYANLVFPISGEVAEVLFAEGDSVAAGDVLVRLKSDEQLEAGLQSAQLELLLAQQALTTLQENAPITASQADSAVTQAHINLLNAQEALDDLDSDDYQEEIDDALDELNDAEQDLEDAQEDYDDVKELDDDSDKKQDAEDDLEDAQNSYDEALRDYDYLITQLEQAQEAVVLAEAQLADAQNQVDSLVDGIDPDDLARSQERIQAAEAGVAAAEAALDHLELKAPFAGRLVELDLAPGEKVIANQRVAQVADLSQLYVETTDLTENEVVDIIIGQQVTITPDALPDLELAGVVESISDGYQEKSGDIVYTIRIILEESDPLLRWGMTVEVKFMQ